MPLKFQTQFAVVLSCMSNNGARAKSLGRVDELATARERFRLAAWEPLGHGAEWSRYVSLVRITPRRNGQPWEQDRETIETRCLD